MLTYSSTDQKENQTQWRELIEKGSDALAIALTLQQVDLLVSYIEQLVKWNNLKASLFMNNNHPYFILIHQ